MSHYTVGYHDLDNHRLQICEYANDAYEAQKDAIEDVPFLKTHPSYIDYVTNDSGLDYLMGVVPMGR
tara:strand:- start:36 stop:236 length:201 start_codon:yes stop_codon:yes gene_type:complete